ncbi:hypothetical protein BRN51_03305 [Xanthomonas oryzae pv. oryzae]|nr:hypothetical protein BRN51_03305 [Xanthomonas oryzae pv. oryzae]RBF82700.1 hypothetical protein BRM95_18365 [Xanthomonas oryzae pv. oryzae]
MKNVNRLRISNSRIGAALAAQQAQRQASGHQQIAQGAEDAPIQMPERFEHFFHRVRIGLCTLCPQAWQNAPCRAVPCSRTVFAIRGVVRGQMQ